MLVTVAWTATVYGILVFRWEIAAQMSFAQWAVFALRMTAPLFLFWLLIDRLDRGDRRRAAVARATPPRAQPSGDR